MEENAQPQPTPKTVEMSEELKKDPLMDALINLEVALAKAAQYQVAQTILEARRRIAKLEAELAETKGKDDEAEGE